VKGVFRGERVLVTGGTGFIGGRLVAQLAKEGAEVHLFARRKTSQPVAAWHLGDARDAKAAAAAVKACLPGFVFSLAAVRDAGPERAKADLDAASALAAALAAAGKGLRRWVRTGFRHGDGMDETLERGWCDEMRRRFGLPMVTLRLFSVYGPGQKSSDVIPRLLLQARSSDAAIVPEGMAVDPVYVDDVVEAYLLAAANERAVGGTFDIGGGRLLAPDQLAREVLEAIGSGKPLAVPGKGGSGGHAARVQPALESLGWRPRTTLRAGVRLLWSELEAGQ
jgi:nucleoside-diphosphate-sugar epimerase